MGTIIWFLTVIVGNKGGYIFPLLDMFSESGMGIYMHTLHHLYNSATNNKADAH